MMSSLKNRWSPFRLHPQPPPTVATPWRNHMCRPLSLLYEPSHCKVLSGSSTHMLPFYPMRGPTFLYFGLPRISGYMYVRVLRAPRACNGNNVDFDAAEIAASQHVIKEHQCTKTFSTLPSAAITRHFAV